MMDNYEVQSVTGASFHKLSDQTDQGNAFGNWDPEKFCVEDSAFGFIRMKMCIRDSWYRIRGYEGMRVLVVDDDKLARNCLLYTSVIL